MPAAAAGEFSSTFPRRRREPRAGRICEILLVHFLRLNPKITAVAVERESKGPCGLRVFLFLFGFRASCPKARIKLEVTIKTETNDLINIEKPPKFAFEIYKKRVVFKRFTPKYDFCCVEGWKRLL